MQCGMQVTACCATHNVHGPGFLSLHMNTLDQTSCQSVNAAYYVMQVVQGYKFNIFYPDLIEKLEAPTYSLEKDPGADEHGSTCMLRCDIKICTFVWCSII